MCGRAGAAEGSGQPRSHSATGACGGTSPDPSHPEKPGGWRFGSGLATHAGIAFAAMTLDALVPFLRCPECGDALTFEPICQRDAEAGTCGLLRCACTVYPVLDGVPILTRDRLDLKSIADTLILAEGPSPADVVTCIEAGEGLVALVDLLAFPVCPWPLNRIGAFRALSLRAPFQGVGLAARRVRVRGLLARRAGLTAEDWMAVFYWHAPQVYDPFNYFFFRYGQPRQVATASLVTILPASERPILDLACGYGHHLHAPTAGGQAAVGVDQNFHQLWVARHYVAPGAAFVCADATRPLPLADGAASAALVADVFQHLYGKDAVLDELRRATGGGPIVVASTGNALAGLDDGEELSPEGYAALFDAHGWRWRALSEDALVRRALAGQAPDLSASSPDDALRQSRFLYYVLDSGDVRFVDHGAFVRRPFEAGPLRINPVYQRDGQRLRLELPSPWYATENGAMLEYMPAQATISPAAEAALARGERTSEVDALLAGFVVIGLPQQYARVSRPVTQKANRGLSNLIGEVKSRLGAGRSVPV